MANSVRKASAIPANDRVTTKAGHDSNDGSRDTPWTSSGKFFNSANSVISPALNIITTGVYSGAINAAIGTSTREFIGDGIIEFNGSNSTFSINTGSGGHGKLANFHCYNFASFSIAPAANGIVTVTNCIIRSTALLGAVVGTVNLANCIFLDVTDNRTSTQQLNLENCAVLGATTLKNVAKCVSTHRGVNTQITYIDAVTAANARYNLCEGLQKLTSDGAMLSFSAFIAAHPTLEANSLDNPGGLQIYVSEAHEGWVPTPTSLLVKKGLNGANIGRTPTTATNIVGKGLFIDIAVNGMAGISEATAEYIDPKIQVLGGSAASLVPTGTPDDRVGYIETDWILLLGGSPGKLWGIDPANALAFNTSKIAPDIENKNVPDSDNGTAHTQPTYPSQVLAASRNPNRLTYECMWSEQVAKPGNAASGYAGADNNGFIPAGTWGRFVWIEQPTIDANGVTNGHPTFDWSQAAPYSVPMARWAKWRIWLRDNYTS